MRRKIREPFVMFDFKRMLKYIKQFLMFELLIKEKTSKSFGVLKQQAQNDFMSWRAREKTRKI